MEIAGFAIGVAGLAGLFRACQDAIDYVDSYRKFGVESRYLSAQFEADKLIFQKWADGVGLSKDGLLDSHDRRLDDPSTVSAVSQVLYSTREVLAAAEPESSKLRPKPGDNILPLRKEGRALTMRQHERIAQTPSATSGNKLSWSLVGKKRFNTQVEKFKLLVERLCNLVPVENTDGSSSDLFHEFKDLRKILQDELEGRSQWLIESKHGVHEVLQWLKGERRKKFYSWLGMTQPDQLYEARQVRSEGTCSWIFHTTSYVEWISPHCKDDTAKLLWIYGPAGFGKSTLCAKIIESIKDKMSFPVAHYFCSSTPEQQQDPNLIVRSLVVQLADQCDNLIDLAQTQMGTKDNRCAGGADLWNLLALAARTIPNCVIAIDGLDECTPADLDPRSHLNLDRSKFLANLKKAVQGTASRVLIVSRDEVDIRSQVSKEGPNCSNLNIYEHGISKSDVGPDVRSFSQSTVNIRLSNKSESVKEEVAEQMAEKSDGMFLWIELQGRHLRGSKSKLQLQKIVREMPAGLERVYDRNWANILKLPSSDRSRALNLLRWACFASRPLTVAEISEALIVEDEDFCDDFISEDEHEEIDQRYVDEEIVGLCGSLIEVRGIRLGEPITSGTVHLTHFSVKEYLLATSAHAELCDTRIDITRNQELHNNHLAITCLRYLRSKGIFKALTASETTRPFLDYAVQSWHLHVSAAGERYLETIHEANGFFEPGNQSWDLWSSYFQKVWQPPPSIECGKEIGHPTRYYYAAWFGLTPTIEYLYDATPETLNSTGGFYGAPVQVACVVGNISVIKVLSGFRADLNIQAGAFGSALNAAAWKGDAAICEYLLQNNVAIGIADPKNRTPLYQASKNGHVEVVKLLLDRGADLSTANSDGWTPINAAASKGHFEVVKLLLDRGADLSTADSDGWTPVHAAASDGHLEVVKLLLDRGADLVTADSDGWTPVNAASMNGHVEVVKLLLDQGADLLTATTDGRTPVYEASSNGHIEVIKLLLDRGADLATPNSDGWTPLHIAVDNGHHEVTRYLVSNSGDVDALTRFNETSLHLACRRDSAEIIELLVNAGFNPLQLDDYGRSSLDWASLYQPCFMAMGYLAVQYTQTPKVLTDQKLRFTSARLIQNALTMTSEISLYQLSHCLLLLGDVTNAQQAFEHDVSIDKKVLRHKAWCNRCSPIQKEITGTSRYVCTSCVDTDLCEQCFKAFREDEKPWRCKSHDFLKVPRDGFESITKEGLDNNREDVRAWLLQLQNIFA